jgi:hypothetical protein
MDLRLAISKAIISLLFFLSSGSLRAIPSEPRCLVPLQILFINGVFNTYKHASDSLESLQEHLENERFESVGLRWDPEMSDIVYNQSRGLLDLLEAYQQKKSEMTKDFWLWVGSVSKAPGWFTKAMRTIQILHASDAQNRDTWRAIAQSEYWIVYGSRVLVVAHSQGNFFANDLIEHIRYSLSLHWDVYQMSARLVSVATPASKVEGDGQYITLNSDGVIKWIPTALKPNISNSIPAPGLFDHEFIKHYLKGNRSGPAITKAILDESKILGEIGRSEKNSVCHNWFHDNVSPNLDKAGDREACVQRCVTTQVDLGSFVCTSECAKLCQCLEN